MSYFLFMAQVINKSDRSAVACAAYRSGESLYSERDGLTKNYKEREVQPESYILSPENSPDWAKNRERLWNEVEKTEKQINSQIAREIVVALPKELSKENQSDLLLEFCKENFSEEGMVADVSIHRDKDHNPHAHIMLTMRPFNEDGTWGNKRKKVNGKSEHLTNWNRKETLVNWRKNFAEKINEKYKELDLENRVSHESYEKQGIDKVAHIRLKREDYQFEKRVKEEAEKTRKPYEPATYYGKLNKEIYEINKELDSHKEKQKVVTTDDAKTNNNINKSLKEIRKNQSLNDVQKSALVMVAKRAKSYVDFAVANKVYKEISEGSWQKKLENQRLKIQAEKNLVNKAHHVYKENPKEVGYYGFNPSSYKEQMKEKIDQLKKRERSYNDEKAKFEAVLKKAELAHEIQKGFTEQEFKHLYPDAADKYKPEEKYHAVQYFKDTGRLMDEKNVQSYAKDKDTSTTVQVPSILSQTRNISKSIFILDRALNKQSRNRTEALKQKQFDEAYKASNKIEQYTLQKKNLSKEIEGNKKLLKSALDKHYGYDTQITNTEALIQLNTKITDGRSKGNIRQDIKQIQADNNHVKGKGNYDQTPQQKIESQYMSHVADGMLQSLDEIQKANEEQKYRKEPTKKRRRGKQRRKDDELEL
ncbi:MobQ family relaxase [Halobacillus amylolyticus]|uniref:MobA/MobL family protein n=1 Tax=Halobacillus amylolyticus TaxID=2932259 RepID=A0ABY4HI62_9BACI|nr:MobQ family relaxase [Halobacillus amylolyticus]UOR14098.1 MobA/MobL family protein [Halobacillus amylolyticus]